MGRNYLVVNEIEEAIQVINESDLTQPFNLQTQSLKFLIALRKQKGEKKRRERNIFILIILP